MLKALICTNTLSGALREGIDGSSTTAGEPFIAAAYRSPLLDAAGAALHSLSRGGHSDDTRVPLTALIQ